MATTGLKRPPDQVRGLKAHEQRLQHAERLAQSGVVTADLPELEERPRRFLSAVGLLIVLGAVLLLLQWFAG